MAKNPKNTTITATPSKGLDEYGNYGENNGPVEDWVKRNSTDDPCDEMVPMSKPGDKDYKC